MGIFRIGIEKWGVTAYLILVAHPFEADHRSAIP